MARLRLSDQWILTTEHPASSHGEPMLVYSQDGVAYKWGDIVSRTPNDGYLSATDLVDNLLWGPGLSETELELVRRFHLVL